MSSRGEDDEMALFLFIWRERGNARLRQPEVYEERGSVERRTKVVISFESAKKRSVRKEQSDASSDGTGLPSRPSDGHELELRDDERPNCLEQTAKRVSPRRRN